MTAGAAKAGATDFIERGAVLDQASGFSNARHVSPPVVHNRAAGID
jgi:hypothetical protein